MINVIDLALAPSEAKAEALVRERAAEFLNVAPGEITHIRPVKRSIDARGSRPLVRLRLEVFIQERFNPEPALLEQLRPVDGRREAIIVGAGPAGYFAALELLERGIKPVIFDRGKDVRTRRRDLRAIQQFSVVDPDSNYCFGEGGAGTYSDGKLYTRSHKRGTIDKAMRLLVEHGANPDILADAHPHIGSNKLPGIVANIRETVLRCGGEIHFDSRVTGLVLDKGKVLGVIVNDREERLAGAVILATGHSARDVYAMLYRQGIRMEAKPFALGVRIEHPQELIDRIQYRQSPREPDLPAASYKLVAQVGKRGVFSFCMCPGGLVVPAATAPGEIVVNGMSMSRRDSPFANSGVVVAVEPEDVAAFGGGGVFSGLEFQKSVEQQLFLFGDGSQKAPAQRLPDFVEGKRSADLPDCSYIPGLIPAPLHQLLPSFIYQHLRQGVLEFEKKMRGYYTAEATVLATESRTSAPVRIPRDAITFMHPQWEGLFPSGEGAGYAGGIISAAMDGQNVARAVAGYLS
ncbi:MAG: FAD-dependent monooxygenase [Haliscomenobacter sp.]|nr:FAD-dependent monooxygenase [Haliscomenobacter sp.]